MMTEDVVSSQSGSTAKGSQQDGLLIEEDPSLSSLDFYPSHQINKQLLELTNADLAITHDDDWILGLGGPHYASMFGLREDITAAAMGKGQGLRSSASTQNQMLSFRPVAPLHVSANRWVRESHATADPDSPIIVERKVTSLLNKLTMENFDSISDQIIAWANRSEKEKDGRTLLQVIRLVFCKAIDEAMWSEMYARLCRKMMEQISPKVRDVGIKNQEGKPIAGGQLFRKYFLNRCQEDFERGWVAKGITTDDEAAKTPNVDKKEKVKPFSEEYYAAAKAKRQGLGVIKLMGELFKLQMLTERIMHECLKKLLGNVENPEEEGLESLCTLLNTVGHLLDTPKAQGHMDIYFSRMEDLTKNDEVSQRVRFMLQDVIELRARKWLPRRPVVAAPISIAQIHENALKEKAAQDREKMQRQMSTSRTTSNHGRGRSPDGWAVAGNRPVASKAGDLSNFGKISNKGQPISFGPSNILSKTAKVEKREPISRVAYSSNMFSMMRNDTAPESKPESQGKTLAVSPRSVPEYDPSRAATTSGSDEDDGAKAAPQMSEADAKKKIAEDCKELFAVRSVDESENYFTALPAKYHNKLVDRLVSIAVESKAADAKLVASVFERASSKRLVAASAFEEGLAAIAEFLEDIAIDAPHAYELFALMVKGAKLDADAHARIAAKDAASKLLSLLS
ncbi:armadillo-type protein [Coprinopsis sp. MPI-PUGE-AT-0042]|nr:armadillo-type protein [Coprinopsis sp. MPI-PUGE-AT-0042]